MIIESRVISQLLKDDNYTIAIDLGLSSEWFLTRQNLIAFKFIYDHFFKYGKVPTVDTLIENNKEFSYTESDEDITVLVDELLKQKQMSLIKNTLIESATLLKSRENPYEYIIEQINKLPQPVSKDIDTINIDEFDIETLYRRKDTFVPIGIYGLDSILGGVKKSNLIYIVARPYVGKSTFMKVCALNQLKQRMNPLIISSEEDVNTIATEMLCFEHGINPTDFWKKQLNETQLNKIRQSIDYYKEHKGNIHIIGCSNITPSFICSQLEKYNPSSFWIDSFGVMGADTNINGRTEKFERIALDLERITKRYKIPGYILHHTTRDSKYVSYTDEVQRRADIIFWLSSTPELDSENKKILKIEKLRGETNYKFQHGDKYTNYALMTWNFETMVFDVECGIDVKEKATGGISINLPDLDEEEMDELAY